MKYTSLMLFIALFIEVVEYKYGHDITNLLHENSILIDLLVAIPILLVGVSIDFYRYYKLKKEAETVAVYKETIRGINHHLRNLLNTMQIIKVSESIKNEFGEEMIDMLQKTEDEAVSALNNLQALSGSDITPKKIKEISEDNISS